MVSGIATVGGGDQGAEWPPDSKIFANSQEKLGKGGGN